MNALANSQLEELKKFFGADPATRQVTFGCFAGQEGTEEREAMKANPPDILLTNFMMLELLLTRQKAIDLLCRLAPDAGPSTCPRIGRQNKQQQSLSFWTSCVTTSWITTAWRSRNSCGKIVSPPRQLRTATSTKTTCRSDADMLTGSNAGHAANAIFPDDKTLVPQKRGLKAIFTRFPTAANTLTNWPSILFPFGSS